jgi:hypothetical protein
MNYSEIHEDLKMRYHRQRMEKVWHWVYIVLGTIGITVVLWSLIMDLVYPRQALPGIQAMTWRQEQAQYWNTLAMMHAEASTTLNK